MAWQLSVEELGDGVREQRERVAGRRSWRTLEQLARGLRWVDLQRESERLFLEAAHDVIERVERQGRGSADMRSRTAGFFTLAGHPKPALEWGRRAVELFTGRAAHDVVDTLYVAGDPEQALAIARKHDIRPWAVELIEAERDGKRCDAFAARLVRHLVAGRTAPSESSGSHPIGLWDWLELAYLTDARITGEPTPSHTEMLTRAGLLAAARRPRRVARVEPGGVDHFPVTAADGTAIEATIDRSSADHVEIVLDPRHDHYFVLTFSWDVILGYVGRVYIEPLTSPQDVLPHDSQDFAEAIEAAVDWLDDLGELWDRDGPWAARTLRGVTQALPLSRT